MTVPKSLFPALAAAGLALALYAAAIPGPYIYDDVQIIGSDARVHTPALWKQLWTKDYFNGGADNLYRPLTSQSYAIQWWVNRDRPWAFRLVNILLQAAVAAAVAVLAGRLASEKAAYIAGLLFAAHPVHVEAVVGIVGRAEELCALFTLCGLVLFLHRPLTLRRALPIAACAVAAMLSKEQGMLFPFLLLALVLATGRKAQSKSETNAMQWLAVLLCFSVSGLIVLREQVLNLPFEWDKVFLDTSIQPLVKSGLTDRALMVFVLLGRYAQLFIAPIRLSIDYGQSVINSTVNRSDPYLYLGFATALAGLPLLTHAIYKRRPAQTFCLLAAALTYAMVSNVILIGTIMNERLIYLPSAFLLIYAAIYLSKLRPIALVPLLSILLLLCAWRTETYAVRWNDRHNFYVVSLAEQPMSIRLHETLAAEMISHGDLEGAQKVTDDAERIAPDYWNVWVLDAKIAEQRGDLNRALEKYRTAFKLHPMVILQNKISRISAATRQSQ